VPWSPRDAEPRATAPEQDEHREHPEHPADRRGIRRAHRPDLQHVDEGVGKGNADHDARARKEHRRAGIAGRTHRRRPDEPKRHRAIGGTDDREERRAYRDDLLVRAEKTEKGRREHDEEHAERHAGYRTEQ
jgi:hypothetical protein